MIRRLMALYSVLVSISITTVSTSSERFTSE